MAELKQSIIGNLNGKLGNIVFRQMKGKTFVSLRPDKYKPTKSTAAKNVRSGFKQINLFVSTINKNPILKGIWSKVKIDARSAYNKIFKQNLNISSKSGISRNNIIVPNSYIYFNNSFSFSEGNLKIFYESEYVKKEFGLETELSCFLLMFYFGPINKGLTPFNAVLFSQETYSEINNNLLFDFSNIINKNYQKVLFFHTLVMLNGTNAEKWCSTTSEEIFFN
jgi:hypothetical protein